MKQAEQEWAFPHVWPRERDTTSRSGCERSLSVEGIFFFPASTPRMCDWNHSRDPVSIAGGGGLRVQAGAHKTCLMPREHHQWLQARPVSTLLLQPTMSLYCEGDELRAETMGNFVQLQSARLKPDQIWRTMCPHEGTWTFQGVRSNDTAIHRLSFELQSVRLTDANEMQPPVDVSLIAYFYNAINPSNFSSGQPNTAAVPWGLVSLAIDSLRSWGQGRRKESGGGDEGDQISKLNFCSSVFGGGSEREFATEGGGRHGMWNFTPHGNCI